MKRPKTYRFSELWTENQIDRLTMEARTDRPMRRRAGRPLGKRWQAKSKSFLKKLKLMVEKGVTLEELAIALDIPLEVLKDWALEELP
jgi:hypothetical protein